MKIVIELADAVLMRAVEEQVGKAVATYAEAAINRQTDQIVAKKLERYGTAEQDMALSAAAKELLIDCLGNNAHHRETVLRAVVNDAAVQLIKGIR